jgi:hypothetical protein
MKPWNSDLFTLINCVVDQIMSKNKIRRDSHLVRYEYILQLCRASLQTKDNIDRDIGIWEVFSLRARALFFPQEETITDASFATHLLVARVLVNDPGMTSELRSKILQNGPKSLSLHNKSSKKTVFGGFLGAAIRSRNADLVCLLLAHDIDISCYTTKSKRKKLAYDPFFLKLSIYTGDAIIVDEILQRRLLEKFQPTKLVLQSVCLGHTGITDSLLNYCFPTQERLNSEYFIGDFSKEWYHGKTPSAKYFYDFQDNYGAKVLRRSLREACIHGDIDSVASLLSCQFTNKGFDFIGEWNKFASDRRPSSWQLQKLDLHRRQALPVTICIIKGEMEILKLLLDHGANPHADLYYAKGETGLYAVTPSVYSSFLYPEIWPMEVCAFRGDTEMAQLLFDAGFKLTTKDWLKIAGRFSGKQPFSSPAYIENDFDWTTHWLKVQQFWRWLADKEFLNPSELLEEQEKIKSIQAEQKLGRIMSLHAEQSTTSTTGWTDSLDEVETFLNGCFSHPD